MDRGAWRVIVHGVSKSQTQLSDSYQVYTDIIGADSCQEAPASSLLYQPQQFFLCLSLRLELVAMTPVVQLGDTVCSQFEAKFHPLKKKA